MQLEHNFIKYKGNPNKLALKTRAEFEQKQRFLVLCESLIQIDYILLQRCE